MSKQQLQQELKAIKQLLNGYALEAYGKNHAEYDSIYPFATEDLTSSMEEVPLQNKRVCTVLGSGDQILNATYYGAKEIMTFDINYLAEHYANLKVAALKVLKYQDFIDYFIYNGSDRYFNYEIFQKFQMHLEESTRYLWENVYQMIHYQGTNLEKSNLFKADIRKEDLSYLRKLSQYIKSEKEYQETQNKIKNVKLQHQNTDIFNLPYLTERTFDAIFLSNILEHVMAEYIQLNKIDYRNMSCYTNQIKKFLLEELPCNLNKEGIIVIVQMMIFPSMNHFYTQSSIAQDPSISLIHHDWNKKFSQIFGILADDKKASPSIDVLEPNKIFYMKAHNHLDSSRY